MLRGKYRIPFYMTTECENLLKRFMVLVPHKRTSLRSAMAEEWMTVGVEPLAPHTNETEGFDEGRLVRSGYLFICGTLRLYRIGQAPGVA